MNNFTELQTSLGLKDFGACAELICSIERDGGGLLLVGMRHPSYWIDSTHVVCSLTTLLPASSRKSYQEGAFLFFFFFVRHFLFFNKALAFYFPPPFHSKRDKIFNFHLGFNCFPFRLTGVLKVLWVNVANTRTWTDLICVSCLWFSSLSEW